MESEENISGNPGGTSAVGAALERANNRTEKKRGPGRPKGSTNKKKDSPGESDVKTSRRNDSGGSNNESVNRASIKRGLSSFFKGIDGYVTKKCSVMAFKVSGGDKSFMAEIANDVALNPDELATMVDMGTEVVCKYDFMSKYLPETLLAVCVLGYTGRVVIATGRIQDVGKARIKHAQESPGVDKTPPPPEHPHR